MQFFATRSWVGLSASSLISIARVSASSACFFRSATSFAAESSASFTLAMLRVPCGVCALTSRMQSANACRETARSLLASKLAMSIAAFSLPEPEPDRKREPPELERSCVRPSISSSSERTSSSHTKSASSTREPPTRCISHAHATCTCFIGTSPSPTLSTHGPLAASALASPPLVSGNPDPDSTDVVAGRPGSDPVDEAPEPAAGRPV
mmetsp:Transcript_2748/g.5566  ORF Transcript_2748/g.5566 Transcript_2748/m.5566 type:complete len:209 (+) Transcript_2748:1686-2312(+)